MLHGLRGCGWSAIVLAGAIVGMAWADDDKEPAYVIQDGQRIPTKITPPNKKPAQAPNRNVATPAVQVQPADPSLAPRPSVAPPDGFQSANPPSSSNEMRDMNPPAGASIPADGAGMAQTPYPRVRIHQGAAYPAPYYFRRDDNNVGLYDPYSPFGVQQSLDDAYWAGRQDERQDTLRRWNEQDMDRRRDRLLSKHQQALNAGVKLLRAGDYARAVISLTMAAELDNGDPACRIHLAQAYMARGNYEEAGKVLRRALQLQPKLVYIDLNLASYYPDAATFDQQAQTLATAVGKRRQVSGDVRFLLGFVEFQRGHFDQAHRAFQQVALTLPKDSLARAYLKITKPAAKTP